MAGALRAWGAGAGGHAGGRAGALAPGAPEAVGGPPRGGGEVGESGGGAEAGGLEDAQHAAEALGAGLLFEVPVGGFDDGEG